MQRLSSSIIRGSSNKGNSSQTLRCFALFLRCFPLLCFCVCFCFALRLLFLLLCFCFALLCFALLCVLALLCFALYAASGPELYPQYMQGLGLMVYSQYMQRLYSQDMLVWAS